MGMLYATPCNLHKHAEVEQALGEEHFYPKAFSYFDLDGFALNPLEQAYYRCNEIPITEVLGVWAAQYPWLILDAQPNFIMDHCFIVTRCCYTEQARAQIQRHALDYPQLRKMLMLKPKWGLDFALEYYDDQDYIELLHIEQDYSSYNQAEDSKQWLQERLLNTDWQDFARQLLKLRDSWSSLEGMARNDWKARYWGLDQAEHTLKAF